MRRHARLFSLFQPAALAGLVLAGTLLSGCEDKNSNLGVEFYPDPIQSSTTVRTDSAFLQASTLTHSVVVNSAGTSYNQTWASPMMLIGRSMQSGDNMESWGILKFDPVSADTLARTTAVRLILKTIAFKYGDEGSNTVDLQVYGQGSGKLTDSLVVLTKSDLTSTPYYSGAMDMTDTTNNVLSMSLDTAVKAQLTSTASFGFVIVPGPTMTNVRGFATSDNTGDAASVPELEYSVKVDTGIVKIYRKPILDMHIVNDQSITPAHEFALRGSLGKRERFAMNLNLPGDTLNLDQFATINSAVLTLHLDAANSRRSNVTSDTLGPAVVGVTLSEDSVVFDGNGVKDPNDPTIYRFQVRGLVQTWLHQTNPAGSKMVFELRSGYSVRTFRTLPQIGVEDNTVNHWTFYGSDADDPAKRPTLTLSYSKLKR